MEKESLFTKNHNIKEDIAFAQRQQLLNPINGWFSPASHGIFSFFWEFQNQYSICGNLGEIGVWEGKSSTIICNFSKESEKIFLIDPLIEKNKEVIYRNIDSVCRRIPDNCLLCNYKSEDFLKENTNQDLLNSFRFFHIDGCHTGSNVYFDMELADKLLTLDAVLVVDDFFNPGYPQITEAVYKYVFLNPYKFRIFFAAFNKAYLCRPEKYTFYYSHTLENLQQNMLSKGMAFTIKKTSSIGDCYTLAAEEFNPQIDLASGMQGPDWNPEKIDYLKNM